MLKFEEKSVAKRLRKDGWGTGSLDRTDVLMSLRSVRLSDQREKTTVLICQQIYPRPHIEQWLLEKSIFQLVGVLKCNALSSHPLQIFVPPPPLYPNKKLPTFIIANTLYLWPASSTESFTLDSFNSFPLLCSLTVLNMPYEANREWGRHNKRKGHELCLFSQWIFMFTSQTLCNVQ